MSYDQNLSNENKTVVQVKVQWPSKMKVSTLPIKNNIGDDWRFA